MVLVIRIVGETDKAARQEYTVNTSIAQGWWKDRSKMKGEWLGGVQGDGVE